MPRANRARRGLIALVAISAMVLVACGKDNKKSSTKAAGGPAIAFVGALTGDSANLGINIRNGVKLAVESIEHPARFPLTSRARSKSVRVRASSRRAAARSLRGDRSRR